MKSTIFRINLLGLLGVAVMAVGVPSMAWAGYAGYAQYIKGHVQLTNQVGRTHELQKGGGVEEEDVLSTAPDAYAQIQMIDGGMMTVRPDSQIKFDRVRFDGKEDGTESALFSLIRGGIRAITGMIGSAHKENYRIATAAATIGIRGTDHEVFVVVPGSSLAGSVPPGTYDKVNKGGTVMTNNKGTLKISPNQMGFAAGINQPPKLLPVNLKIFTTVPSPSGNVGNEARANSVVDSQLPGVWSQPGYIHQNNTQQTPIRGSTSSTSPTLTF